MCAGTSTSRFDHFRAEAAAFQQQWKAYFEPRVLDAATLDAELNTRRRRRSRMSMNRRRRWCGASRHAASSVHGAWLASRCCLDRLPAAIEGTRCDRGRSRLTARRSAATLAVDHLNLTIKPGEVFCLLGANGAGKTTTINLFLNFIAPTSGEARIAGLNVVEHPLETKKRLAYIPEQVTLYRNLTGLENLRFFSRLAGAHAGFRSTSCWRSSRRPD